MNIENLDMKITLDGKCEVILKTSDKDKAHSLMNEYEAKKDKTWEATIEIKRKKRSLDANAYMWVLADKIADKLNTTKEAVYKEAIKDVGAFESLLIQDKAVDKFIELWEKQGIGNVAQVMYQSKVVDGCTAVRVYYGSSTYDTKQMSRLIDYIVSEAKEQGIETLTPDEIARLKSVWRGNSRPL
nr:MAG TPA: NinB protein [Caudoviricetes sp.]